ncbi:tyrosine-type recombinase/integrase [Rubrivivax gelatinosus]|uniref:tyrosine-type recombinase/integrase n=1 Tax=Rubrivivax gelatinosus TaxID=28068 RepID=UPI001A28C462|nr:integrase arm-type DNA-binding domain-containing protein [Rubrivivax gelatinosus]MBG6082722.1 integrase [Rubrivivax gelatinosus]
MSRIAKPGMHFVGGVAGLALQVTKTGGRCWVLRATIAGKTRDMGLGGFPDVTLADAREAARRAREKIRQGIDPIEERRRAQEELKLQKSRAITFKKAAEKYIEIHEPSWRSAKHGQQWRNSLATHAYPKIGDMLVKDIELSEVLGVLEPIWRTKTETANRVRGRMESILDWATTSRYREGLNPARWKGHLENLLPAPGKIKKGQHHPAHPIDAMPAFMQDLRSAAGLGARALEFAILTAARSGEVRGARWTEIDLKAGLWTVPSERMKAGKEHRVPLSTAALRLLQELPRMDGTDLVFASPRRKPLSDMTLSAVTRRLGVDAVPHGFRSTFRDWAAERTVYPSEMAEMALAHTVGDKVEAAYLRSDLFEKRRRMMDDWAAFLERSPLPAEVVDLGERRAAG